MQVGRMRYRIEIQDYKSTQDADGFETREWMTVHTVWADIAPVSGKEYMASNRETAEITNKIYIRFRSGIKSTMKIKIKDKEVVSLPVRCEYINGSEEIPFDESCLTENQKEMIEFGLKTLDDFKPKGSIFGQRITKFFCIDVDARDDYADGYKVEQITSGEFSTEIFTPAATEVKAADVKDNSDIEALFG